MTPIQHSAETEYEQLRSWLLDPSADVEFHDAANRRLMDVLRAVEHRTATSLELAVLLRQHARRWTLARGASAPLETRGFSRWLDSDATSTVGLVITPHQDRDLITAHTWEPAWLENPSGIPIDEPAAAGTTFGDRRRPGATTADPIFVTATGFADYKTPGQRAAVRMVLEMDPRGVMIANLPTGSGKTEVAVTLARSFDAEGGGTVVIVVPTIALAQDLEARFRAQWARIARRGVDVSKVPFAWTSETNSDQREQLRDRLKTGRQPMVVTSPESLTGALLETVRTGAATGRVRALVVDEAHLIVQWGRSFRPEFRLLGELWRELNASSDPGVRALLLSATMSSEVVEDLLDVFRSDKGPSIVAANAIRTEPRFWVAPMTSFEDRRQRVLEALAHLPRPCILYVTQPKFAERWMRGLRALGYRRVIEVTGDSLDAHRRDALNGLRTTDSGSRYDVVVATAAFGLGIDADEIRTIVHACLPETADRWYQEVGRAGRDGYASIALLAPAFGDVDEALSLGVRVLTPDIAFERWNAMWAKRVDIAERSYVNLRFAPPKKADGSYNRRWNAQILDGLSELGVLNRAILSWDEARRLELPSVDTPTTNLRDAWQLITFRGATPDRAFFDGSWTHWKTGVESASLASVGALEAMIATQDACGTIESIYRPSDELAERLGIDSVAGFGISIPCSRCQVCAACGHIDSVDPAPEPSIRWADVAVGSRFEHFVDHNTFGRGTKLGALDRVAVFESEEEEAAELTSLLVGCGVRLGSGPVFASQRRQFHYFDESPDPISMLPIPALVSVPDPNSLRDLLEHLRLRASRGDGRPGPVLVHVREVSRDLRAQRPLTPHDLRSHLERIT